MSAMNEFRSPTCRRAGIASIYILAATALAHEFWPAIVPMWLVWLGLLAVIAVGNAALRRPGGWNRKNALVRAAIALAVIVAS